MADVAQDAEALTRPAADNVLQMWPVSKLVKSTQAMKRRTPLPRLMRRSTLRNLEMDPLKRARTQSQCRKTRLAAVILPKSNQMFRSDCQCSIVLPLLTPSWRPRFTCARL